MTDMQKVIQDDMFLKWELNTTLVGVTLPILRILHQKSFWHGVHSKHRNGTQSYFSSTRIFIGLPKEDLCDAESKPVNYIFFFTL